MKKNYHQPIVASSILTAALSLVTVLNLSAFPVITNVVETGGDAEATDTILAAWTGVTFTNGVANEPIAGKGANDPYTVGFFGEEAPMFVDRNHQWNGATTALPLPKYLVGGEYIMSGNDNRDNNPYQLDISISQESYVYLLVDDRMGDNANGNPPNFPDWLGDLNGDGLPDMGWLLTEGWTPVKNGLNRFGNPDWPDHVGADEGGDGVGPGVAINQWSSIYVKRIPAGMFSIFSPDNPGRNMYGVVVKPVPPNPTLLGFSHLPNRLTIRVTDGSQTGVNTNTIQLRLDGTTATPLTITKTGFDTTIEYIPSPAFPSGSSHGAELTFADTAGAPYTNAFNFTTVVYATLPASLAMPAGSVDTTASGFAAFVHQARIDASLQNNTERAEAQVRGLLIDPNTGTPFVNHALGGPNFTNLLVNFEQAAVAGGNFNLNNGFPDGFIPGIPGDEASTDNIAAEFIAYVQLTGGLNQFGVNSDDGFRVTAARNPRDLSGLELGVFNGGRGFGDTLFYVNVEADGIYPIRLLWYEGGGGAGVEFFSVNFSNGPRLLVNDGSNPSAVKAYYRATLVSPPIVNQIRPLPGALNVNPAIDVFVELLDQATQVNPLSVALSFNGAPVLASVTNNAGSTRISYDPPGLLASGSTNEVTLVYADNAAALHTNRWKFTVADYSAFPVLPPNFKVAPGSIDLNQPGFRARVHQQIAARTGGNNYPAPEIQLDPGFIDPLTGQPYVNDATPSGEPDGLYTITNVVNFEQGAGAAGTFNPNDLIPGIPGVNFSTDHIAAEFLTFLELKAGAYQFGVNCDDGFRLTTAQHVRDLFVQQMGVRSPGGGAADVLFNFVVQEDGIYPFRLLWWEGTGGASVEWFHFDPFSGQRILINDRRHTTAVNAYRAYTGTPIPYVRSVKPRINERVVPADTAIEALMGNVGTSTVTMYVNGQQVTTTSTPQGTNTLIRHTPPTTFAASSTNTVALVYAGVSNSWSFVIGTGPKILYLLANAALPNASDAALIARLESFGFDVLPVSAAASVTEDAGGAVLVVNSSTVASGDIGTKFRSVAVPVVSWEQANQDDYLMTLDTADVDRGELAGQTNIVIVNATHPVAAGLPAGARTVTSSPQTFTWGQPAASATVIATLDDGTARPCLYGYDTGALLIDGTTPAPARRVHVFLSDNAYAALTPDGVKLIDAALSWAMNRPLTPQLQFTSISASGGNVTMNWTGSGTLQEAANLTGSPSDWSNVNPQPTGNTLTVPIGSSAQKFYRIRQ